MTYHLVTTRTKIVTAEETPPPPTGDPVVSGTATQRTVVGPDGLSRGVVTGSGSVTSEVVNADGSTATTTVSGTATSVDGGPVSGNVRVNGTYESDRLDATAGARIDNETGRVVVGGDAELSTPILEGGLDAFAGVGATVVPGVGSSGYAEAGVRGGTQDGPDSLSGELKVVGRTTGPAAVEVAVEGRARIVDDPNGTLDAFGRAGGSLPLNNDPASGFVEAGLEGRVQDEVGAASGTVTYRNGTGEQPTVNATARLETEVGDGVQGYVGANGTYDVNRGAVTGGSVVVGVESQSSPPGSIDAAGATREAVQDYQVLNSQLGVARGFIANYGPVAGMLNYQGFLDTAQTSGIGAATDELPPGLALGTDAALRRQIDGLDQAVGALPEGDRAGAFRESGERALERTGEGLNVINDTRLRSISEPQGDGSPARALDAPSQPAVGIER